MLSKAAKKVLEMMVKDDEELVCSGGECWVDIYRTSYNVVYELLQLCLISEDSSSRDDYQMYWANSEAKEILKNNNYVPEIVKILRKRNG